MRIRLAPIAGSGGFLIRCFEILCERIAADVDTQYKTFCADIDKKKLPEAEKAKRKLEKYLATHPSPQAVEYYLCGPPMMIKACTKMLASLGVPDNHISYDEF